MRCARLWKFHTGPMRTPLDNDPTVVGCGMHGAVPVGLVWWYSSSYYLVQKAGAPTPSEGEIETWEEAFDFCSFECWWNWSAKVDCQDRSWVSHARTKNGFNKQSRKRLWLCQSAPLRSAPLPACLLASFPLTRRSNKTTLHSGHEQSSIAQARHSHQQPVLFCSVPFRSVPSRSRSRSRWRESQLPPVTHCAVHRLLSFLVMLTLENTGSAAHSPLAVFVLQKSKVPPESRRFPLSRWRKQEAPVCQP